MSEHLSETRGGGNRVSGDAGSRQQIADDHKALGKLLVSLETTRDPHALLPQLEALAGLLQGHFRREEAADGFHEMVSGSAPHLLPSVQSLFDEHREMATQLDDLKAQARQCIEGPVAQLLAGTSELIVRLREHEQAEDELVVGALYADLGTSS